VPLLAIESIGLRLHPFAGGRKRARGAVGLCGARALPNEGTSRTHFCPRAGRTSLRRHRACQYGGADEPCDLFHADSLARKHRSGVDGYQYPASAGEPGRRQCYWTGPRQPGRCTRGNCPLSSRDAPPFPGLSSALSSCWSGLSSGLGSHAAANRRPSTRLVS
jgi:hypothetical protein